MSVMLYTLLFFSFLLNLLLIWYARKMTRQFVFFSENIDKIQAYLESFDGHIKGIHELEMFYGDDTLGSLMEHSRDLIEKINNFNDSFTLEEQEEEEEDAGA